jgi:outer membrane cobalamin receptor
MESRHRTRNRSYLAAAAVVMIAAGAATAGFAAGIPTGEPLEEVVVTARRVGLIGESQAASEGIVTSVQLEGRPILRPGEVLEVVPGLVVTQHSGDGKANQYFLRGFNLDHGTDFATCVDGVPVNMPTHAHGQGYADINFLIHELVDEVHYRKGPYYAEQGNFSAAGAAQIGYVRDSGAPALGVTVGQDDYYRVLGTASSQVGDGTLLLGLDWSQGDGPWKRPQDFQKTSGVVKYSHGNDSRGWSLAAMGYDGSWNSTDQVPQRAVDDGSIDRFGSIDKTTGGESHRYSLSFDLWSRQDGRGWNAIVYAIDYYLDLISNFTYAIDQVDGDQFEQYDDRRVYGGRYVYDMDASFNGLVGVLQAGAEFRYDDIHPVALYRTRERERFETIRKDDVTQGQYSAFVSHDQRWTPWLRTTAGLRFDLFDFQVDGDLTANSGSETDSLAQPKLTVVLGPWNQTEFFLNAGRGFHTNDARGTTITVDPVDGVTPVDPVDPIVPADGAEVGLRTAIVPKTQLTAAFWGLDIDSELLFVGDGGITEPSRATRRYGVELGAYWTPLDWLIVDGDYAWSHARFTESDPAGDYIPGAVETVVSLGITVHRDRGWYGGARWRYFGPAPLIEDGSVRSRPTSLVNLDAGYRFTQKFSVMATVFNVFDTDANDITYYYDSQLPGESQPVADIHFHPVEPRTLRVTGTLQF